MIYNPQPTRVWFRQQQACSINSNIPNDIIYIPLANQYVTPSQAQCLAQELNKLNVLKYKNNSTNFSKKQQQSRIYRGLNNTGKQSYSTQNYLYTNPNTSKLSRINFSLIPNPNTIVGSPNNPSGPFQTINLNPTDPNTQFLIDGGNLLCNSQQLNFSPNCFDISGNPINLAFFANTQTWYPKPRYTMPTSLSKWPQGYKGFVSAVTPVSPVLSISLNSDNTRATLSWTVNTSPCIPISSFQIFQNNEYFNTVAYPVTSTIINNLDPTQTYTYYVTAVSTNISSQPSNIVSTSLS